MPGKSDLGSDVRKIEQAGPIQQGAEALASYNSLPAEERQFSEDEYIRVKMVEIHLTSPLHYSKDENHLFYSKAIPKALDQFKYVFGKEYKGKYLDELLHLEEKEEKHHQEMLKGMS